MDVNGRFYSYKKTEGQGYDELLQKCIEDTCQFCLDNTFMEAQEKINKPIMMLGKIQSGKTRAFTGLIALAFDNDFDMVFILTKNSKALVEQTISRMKKEFYFEKNSVIVTDIIKATSKISGFELEQKNIIVAKKQKHNISKLIEFIEKYSISSKKKCLIIDDEADTTGIGYEKVKDSDMFTLRTVSSKVNEMRGTLDGCVFVEVTATPYALYLQPEFNENEQIKPIKPLKTILVPHGKDYIGGEYYFIKSKDETHPASLIFEPMTQEECDLVADQKRNGKKSKIEDRRSFKEEEILTNENRLAIFKKGLVNFIIGTIVMRELYDQNARYAYVIHTAMQMTSHFSLESAAEIFLHQIKHRNSDNSKYIKALLHESYSDIKKSVEMHNLTMPEYSFVKENFYNYIDKGYYSIDVVNADQDIGVLLDEESGELFLRTPCSIFVGGQVLDRGVTIHNMIGFYYGRNPNTMQQDTVLQHSRMFGYRKQLLPVTRFYTTMRIHSNMQKITEIDTELRDDIEYGKQGSGVYFITNKLQDKQFGVGGIKPCTPNKIRVSDIIMLKPYRRILPIGFSPVIKTEYFSLSRKIEKFIKNNEKHFTISLDIEDAIELIKLVYKTFNADDNSMFVDIDEFITTLKYMSSQENKQITFVIRKDRNIKKYKASGVLLDSPETGSDELREARSLATINPVIILLQQNGDDESWGYRPFWWPILVAPSNTPKTMYASKVANEKVQVSKGVK